MGEEMYDFVSIDIGIQLQQEGRKHLLELHPNHAVYNFSGHLRKHSKWFYGKRGEVMLIMLISDHGKEEAGFTALVSEHEGYLPHVHPTTSPTQPTKAPTKLNKKLKYVLELACDKDTYKGYGLQRPGCQSRNDEFQFSGPLNISAAIVPHGIDPYSDRVWGWKKRSITVWDYTKFDKN